MILKPNSNKPDIHLCRGCFQEKEKIGKKVMVVSGTGLYIQSRTSYKVVRAATPSLGKEEEALVRSYSVTPSPAQPLQFESKLEGRCSHYDNSLI